MSRPTRRLLAVVLPEELQSYGPNAGIPETWGKTESGPSPVAKNIGDVTVFGGQAVQAREGQVKSRCISNSTIQSGVKLKIVPGEEAP